MRTKRNATFCRALSPQEAVRSACALLACVAVLAATLAAVVIPLMQAAADINLPYTAVVDFDGKLYTSKEAGSAGWTEGDGFGRTGKGLKWQPSVSVSRIYFTPTNNAADEAFVFWMSGEDIAWSTPRDIQLYLHDTDGNRCFHLPKGATYYRVGDDGEKETVSVTLDKFVQLENGFSGWYVIPLSSLTVTWGPSLSERPLSGGFCNLQLYNEWPAPNTIYLDDLGFTADMDGFIAAAGNGITTGTTAGSTTTATTTTQPVTPPADGEDFQTVVDFDGKLYTSKDAGSAGWAEENGFGRTGKGLKWQPSVSVSRIYFTPTNNAADEAFVFWMSGEDIAWSTPRDIQLYLHDTDGNRCFHLPKGATYYRVGDDGEKETVSVTLDKFVQLENGFSGWYIIPLSSLTVTWGPALADRPLSGGFCGIQLYNEWPAPNTIYLDDLGFTADMTAFMEARTGTTTESTTTTTESTTTTTESTTKPTQPVGNDVVEAWPGEKEGFYLAVNFDKLQPLKLTPSENARVTVVQETGTYGSYLLWRQDAADGNTASKLVVDFEAGGRTADTAIVFRIVTGNQSPWFTPHLYESVKGEDCFRLKDGEQTYYTVGDDGILDTRRCSGRTFRISPHFSGWVVLPYDIFEHFWGDDTTKTLDAEGINSLSLFYNDGVPADELTVDQIGHTDRIDTLLGALCGETDGENGDGLFRPAVDFDNRSGRITFPSSDNRAGAGEKVAVSPSPFENAFKWSRPQAEGTMSQIDVMFNAVGEETDEAFAFWISMAQSDIMGTASFRAFLYDTESGNDCFKLPLGATFYTIGADGISNTHVVSADQHIDLPREFEGWVVVPFASLATFWTEGGNGEVDIPHITSFSLILDNAGFTGNIYLDNIGFASSLNSFLTTYGELPKEDVPYVPFNNFDHLTDDGEGVGTAPADGISVWSEDAEVTVTGDWSEDYYGLYITSDRAATLYLNSAVEDPSLVAGAGGVAFWTDTAEAVDITLSLQTATGTLKWDTDDLRQDLYYLIDYDSGDATAHPFTKAGVLSLPAGFCGYVAISSTCFADGTDMAAVKGMQFRFNQAVELYLDSVCLFKEAYHYITKGINSEPDDDLLFSLTDAVQVDNENKIIIVKTAMNSTAFRQAVAVRFGYRMVFGDTKKAPLFGGVSDMAQIGCVDIYLSGDHAVTYELRTAYEGGSPATGDPSLWPFALFGLISAAALAVAVRRRIHS